MVRYPSIKFHINETVSFNPQDGCTNLAKEVLEALLLESRQAVNAIETELQRQNQKSALKPKVDDCRQRLQQTAKEITVRKRLGARAAAQAEALHDLLTTKHSDRNLRVYQEFLCDVIQQCGPEIALLCAVGIGKHKVANLKDDDRVDLLELLKNEQKTLGVEELRMLARDYHIPDRPGKYGQMESKRMRLISLLCRSAI